MAVYNKFNIFVQNIANGVMNLATDQLVIALSNSAPVATNSALADISQISYTNLSSRNVTTVSSTQASGVYSLILSDLVLTASGAVATFRYVVLYDSTASGSPLIAWWDYGSSITMAISETFTIDFSQVSGVLQIT